ncbi:hypothetical protein ACIG53_02395 [Streptomyces bauhiniae]|uniref:hypothetical protein n=1 Tax=Streptomyces bauhiniae TaxID=2340725 RepID=UPI0037D7CF3A
MFHTATSLYREVWLQNGIPPAYEGSPRVLEADVPEGSAVSGWRFSAGGCRVSMACGFMIGRGGEFGIDADHWTPLRSCGRVQLEQGAPPPAGTPVLQHNFVETSIGQIAGDLTKWLATRAT